MHLTGGKHFKLTILYLRVELLKKNSLITAADDLANTNIWKYATTITTKMMKIAFHNFLVFDIRITIYNIVTKD